MGQPFVHASHNFLGVLARPLNPVTWNIAPNSLIFLNPILCANSIDKA